MDGIEDEILWEETEDVRNTPVDDENEDDNEGVYADHLTSEEWQNLVGDSDDEDFGSFEYAGTLLTPKTPPLGATKLTKVCDKNGFIVSLCTEFIMAETARVNLGMRRWKQGA